MLKYSFAQKDEWLSCGGSGGCWKNHSEPNRHKYNAYFGVKTTDLFGYSMFYIDVLLTNSYEFLFGFIDQLIAYEPRTYTSKLLSSGPRNDNPLERCFSPLDADASNG